MNWLSIFYLAICLKGFESACLGASNTATIWPNVVEAIGNGGEKGNKSNKKKNWSRGEVITLNAGFSKVGLVARGKLQIWILRSLEPKQRGK